MTTESQNTSACGGTAGVGTGDRLADLKRSLDAAVREYEAALMRKPTNEEEIRVAVDKCVSARERYNAALANTKVSPGVVL